MVSAAMRPDWPVAASVSGSVSLSFLGLAAAAVTALAPNAALFTDVTPPTRFQQDATVVLQTSDQAGIDGACQTLFGKPPTGRKTNACFTGQRVIMPNPCAFPASDAYAHMLCHELGHANGWPSTHGR